MSDDLYEVISPFFADCGVLISGTKFRVGAVNSVAGTVDIKVEYPDMNGNIFYLYYKITASDFLSNCIPVVEKLPVGNQQSLNAAQTPIQQRCECGAHPIGIDHHSSWCPLWTK